MEYAKKIHFIHSFNREELISLLEKHKSLTKIISELKIKSYKTLQRKLKLENIDYKFYCTKNTKGIDKISSENMFVEHSKYSKVGVKKRIIRDMLLEHRCQLCGQGKIWNNKELVLALDHINGINDDNRIENLRFLCPNCHTQTDTFAGRNYKRNKNYCLDCKNQIYRNAIRCKTCNYKYRKIKGNSKPPKNYKIIDPPLDMEKLKILLWEKPTCEISKSLGVSDSLITRWCRRYGVEKPPRGYWAKKKFGKLA